MIVKQQDWCSKWALYSPGKICVKEYETNRRLTYAELNNQANHLAYFIAEQYGIQKGDRIAIVAENCLEYIILFAVAQKTGCILVPLNYRLASEEIDYLLQNADPKLVITEAKFQAVVQSTATFSKIVHHWSMEALKMFCENFNEQPFNDYPLVELHEDDPIFILYTSGTTGFPKGALYTHKMLFWNSINTALSLVVNTESRTLNCMPPFHTGGWNVLTTPFLHHGAYVCMMKSFDAKTALKLLEQEEVSIFMGVPTLLKMIADEPGFDKATFSKLNYIIVGGEPMPIPLIEKWHDKNVPIRQGFGMTEVGPNLTSLHQDDAIRKKGAIGRPNFYVQIKVVDEDNNEVGVNESGELLLKGPMVTPGYWRNEQATKKAIQGGWFHSGDMVRVDEEQYIYVVDRIKNMFISGGENVYPAEIERILLKHEAVDEVVVIAVADEKWGETGKAFIVKNKALKLDANDVSSFCQSKLAKFKIPKHIVFVKEIPKNDTGKINRQILKNSHAKT